MKSLLIEPHYLGSLEYFTLALQHDEIWWEVNDYFPKQTFRNRCYILSASEVALLSIPVSYNKGTIMKDVRIDYNQRWVKDHWGAFYSAYGKAPYFDFFAPEFEKIYQKKNDFLVDLNYEMMTLCLGLLQYDIPVRFTEKFHSTMEFGCSDARNEIHPKISFHDRKIYLPFSYIQIFGSKFVPNLSIVDLLLCEGPGAAGVLASSKYPADEHL